MQNMRAQRGLDPMTTGNGNSPNIGPLLTPESFGPCIDMPFRDVRHVSLSVRDPKQKPALRFPTVPKVDSPSLARSLFPSDAYHQFEAQLLKSTEQIRGLGNGRKVTNTMVAELYHLVDPVIGRRIHHMVSAHWSQFYHGHREDILQESMLALWKTLQPAHRVRNRLQVATNPKATLIKTIHHVVANAIRKICTAYGYPMPRDPALSRLIAGGAHDDADAGCLPMGLIEQTEVRYLDPDMLLARIEEMTRNGHLFSQTVKRALLDYLIDCGVITVSAQSVDTIEVKLPVHPDKPTRTAAQNARRVLESWIRRELGKA